jgi:hypothetical protein
MNAKWRAQILLKSDIRAGGPDWSYKAICEAFDVAQPTISDVRQTFVESGTVCGHSVAI